MLHENYFDDAFILHDSTSYHLHLLEMADYTRKEKEKMIIQNEEVNTQDGILSVSKKIVSNDGDGKTERCLFYSNLLKKLFLFTF